MTLDYQLALTNVPFDNSYKNVLRFDNRELQEAHFNVNALFLNAEYVNFNVGSLYATNVVYDCPQGQSINELLNQNYCIVKDNSANRTLNYYYYFITNAIQDCDNRILLSLELDIFNTYYIDLQFNDCLIERAHLNRFIQDPNNINKVIFDSTPKSKLFEREPITNVAKHTTALETLPYFSSATNIGKWLNNNIKGWLYIYCDTQFKINGISIYNGKNLEVGVTPTYITTNIKQLPLNLGVIVLPIYKDFGSHYILFNDTLEIGTPLGNHVTMWGDGQNVLEKFIAKANGYNYIYNITIDTTPPFNLYNVDYEIDIYGNLLLKNVTFYENGMAENTLLTNPTNLVGRGSLFGYDWSGIHYPLSDGTLLGVPAAYTVINETNYNDFILPEYKLPYNISFLKTDIIGSNKNSIYNPKLLNNDYLEIRLSDESLEAFIYDAQKLNNDSINVKITYPLTPDIKRKYIRIDTSPNSVYGEFADKNLIGVITQNDTGLIMPTTQFQTMLANNKNYFLQNAINRDLDLMKGTMRSGAGVIGGILSGNPLGLIAGISGAISNQINTGIEYGKSIINEQLTVDNLKAAPSNIVAGKGNPYIYFNINEGGIKLEIRDILDAEKEIVNDFMCQFGFSYGCIDNIKNVDNIRKYYNFIKADVETISGITISDRVHQKFREIFKQGVRLWNTDTFEYNLENYERWLEE